MAFRFNFGNGDGCDARDGAESKSMDTDETVTPVAAQSSQAELAQEVRVSSLEALAATLDHTRAEQVHLAPTATRGADFGDTSHCVRPYLFTIGEIAGENAATALKRVTRTDIGTTDIVPGVYEGGLKLWECAVDLASFLYASGAPADAISSHDEGNKAEKDRLDLLDLCKRGPVAELGCGHGLPGILCLLAGAPAVHMFDFNADVLAYTTAANVALNVRHSFSDPHDARARELFEHVRYFSGDWQSLSASVLCKTKAVAGSITASTPEGQEVNDSCARQTYTLMLSADCLYTAEVTKKLAIMLYAHLRWPDGVALIAAKRYYFGTGGGVSHFKDCISSLPIATGSGADAHTALSHVGAKLRARTVWLAEDQQSNIREIVQVDYGSEAAACWTACAMEPSNSHSGWMDSVKAFWKLQGLSSKQHDRQEREEIVDTILRRAVGTCPGVVLAFIRTCRAHNRPASMEFYSDRTDPRVLPLLYKTWLGDLDVLMDAVDEASAEAGKAATEAQPADHAQWCHHFCASLAARTFMLRDTLRHDGVLEAPSQHVQPTSGSSEQKAATVLERLGFCHESERCLEPCAASLELSPECAIRKAGGVEQALEQVRALEAALKAKYGVSSTKMPTQQQRQLNELSLRKARIKLLRGQMPSPPKKDKETNTFAGAD